MSIKIDDLKIAHRGLWDKEIPENSLGAFSRCIKEGIPIELDVHLLKDGELIVFHDDNSSRMTGVDAKIKDMTLKDVEHFRLLNSEEKIPTLKEVLDLVDGKVLLDIEIKTDVKGFKICRKVAELLDGYRGEFFVKSFNPLYIWWFKRHRPIFTRGILASRHKGSKMLRPLKIISSSMILNSLCKPDFIAYNHKDLPNKKIEKLSKKGIPIILWTVREEKIDSKYAGIIYEKTYGKE